MQIDPDSFSRKDAYFFAISLITPRPIAFITSRDREGLVNAAPFSYFNGISTKPVLVTVSIANKKDTEKDTIRNIRERKEFCINMINREMCEGVTISSADFPPDVSEMNYNGFTLTECEQIDIPRVKESPASLECRLERIIDDLGNFSLVIGRVILYHVRDNLIDPETGYVKTKDADFIGRLGGSDFSTLGDIISVPRRPWESYSPVDRQ